MLKESTYFYCMRYYLFLFMLLVSCSGMVKTRQAPPALNVIIILADDLGYGDISCYGPSATATPNIDRLAREGVRCTDFYVTTPYCAPSRASILTGKFPLRHGLIKNPAPDAGINDVGIAAGETLLGEVFQKAGYRTKCIGKWHLGHLPEYFPVKHGFDEYYGILYSNDMRPVQIIENMDTVEYPVDQSLLTQKYTHEALKFIRENKDRPFFLHLCHAMPHKPLAASEQFYTPETPEDLYADVIRELDWSTGEIMDELKSLNILGRTIVIFMSDNGPWYGGSAGLLKGMKANNWEGGVRIPFIISYPEELPTDTVVTIPCWSPDIYPTLLSLTGLDKPDSVYLDGEDITRILTGDKHEHGVIFSLHRDKIMSIRKNDWKLFIEKPQFYRPVDLFNWKDPRGPDGKTIIAPYEQATPAQYPGIKPFELKGNTYLFNLAQDIAEMNNVSDEYPGIVQDLFSEYSTFLESLENK